MGWEACRENSFISLKKFLLRSCQNCPQFSARICGIAVGKWVEVFTEMFKAVEVWILHNSIKMCILVITKSEKKIQRKHKEGCEGIKDFMPMVSGFVKVISRVLKPGPCFWWVSSEWSPATNLLSLRRTNHLWKDKHGVISLHGAKEIVDVTKCFCSNNG